MRDVKAFCVVLALAIVVSSAKVVSAGQWEPAKPMSRGQPVLLTEEIAGAPLVQPHKVFANTAMDDDWVAVAAGPRREVAVAWIAFDDRADRVMCCQGSRRTAGSDVVWGKIEELAGPGDYCTTAVAFDGQANVWVVWSANVNGSYELFARQKTEAGWQQTRTLTNSPGSDFAPSLALDAKRRMWLAWQGVRNRNFDILLARLTPTGLEGIRAVTDHSANDWSPSLTAAPTGKLYVAWDTYRNGSYDVYLREIIDEEMSEPIPIAAGPEREAHASVAVDRDDRVWVAYDIGEVNWGRRVRLHGQRSIGLRCFKDGRVGEPVADFIASLSPDLQAKTERPKIAFDNAGRLHMAFMHFVLKGPKRERTGAAKTKRKRPKSHGIFCWYVATCDEKGWQQPRCLAKSSGRGDDRLKLAVSDRGAVWAAWSTDGRQFPYYEVRINGDVCVAPITAGSTSSPGVRLSVTEGALPKVSPAEPDPTASRERRPTVRLGDEDYVLLFGDTHRHTDMSRCALGADGALVAAYRYAIDVAGLDFLSISDHDQDLLGWRFEKPHPILKNYRWWYSQKLADLYTIPGQFVALYGYERGRVTDHGGGHKNIVSARRGYPIAVKEEQGELFAELAGKDLVVIPHQLADGAAATDWDKWGQQFERVAEIFQARGSYEFLNAPRSAKIQKPGHCIWDALEKGVRIGIIASSDHGLTHNAYAGVYAEDFTREAILKAICHRRTFGATTPVRVSVALDGAPMGNELTCAGHPAFHVSVAGPQPLAKVEVVKNNEFIYTHPASGNAVEFEFVDSASQQGSDAYYYIRVTTQGEEFAWTSPFWVERE